MTQSPQTSTNLELSIRLEGIYLFALHQLIAMPHVRVMSTLPPKPDIRLDTQLFAGNQWARSPASGSRETDAQENERPMGPVFFGGIDGLFGCIHHAPLGVVSTVRRSNKYKIGVRCTATEKAYSHGRAPGDADPPSDRGPGHLHCRSQNLGARRECFQRRSQATRAHDEE